MTLLIGAGVSSESSTAGHSPKARERHERKTKTKSKQRLVRRAAAGRPSSAPRAREAVLSPARAHPAPRRRRPAPVPHGAPGPAPAVGRSSGLPLPGRSGLLLLHVQPHFPAEHDGLQERERAVTSCV